MADKYVKLDDVLKLLNRNSITKAITFSDGISIYDSVQNLPTSDVVPKSEVEKIFEEIETIIDNNTYKSYLPNSSLWSKGYKIKQIIAEIAELKKKYTEEYHEIS